MRTDKPRQELSIPRRQSKQMARGGKYDWFRGRRPCSGAEPEILEVVHRIYGPLNSPEQGRWHHRSVRWGREATHQTLPASRRAHPVDDRMLGVPSPLQEVADHPTLLPERTEGDCLGTMVQVPSSDRVELRMLSRECIQLPSFNPLPNRKAWVSCPHARPRPQLSSTTCSCRRQPEQRFRRTP